MFVPKMLRCGKLHEKLTGIDKSRRINGLQGRGESEGASFNQQPVAAR